MQTEVKNVISAALLGPDGNRVDLLENCALGAGLARCVNLSQDWLPLADKLAELQGWHQKGEWRLLIMGDELMTVNRITLLMSAWFQR